MRRHTPIFEKGSTGSISFGHSTFDSSRGVFLLYVVGVSTFFLLVILRLFQLTIVKGDYYAGLADDNRVREITIEAPRGSISDRKGIILASNNSPDVDSSDDRVSSKRIYYKSDAISHVIGYRQTADATDLKNDACLNKLKLGDKTGKKGVEQLYECELRGKRGKKLVEVDAHGQEIKTLSILPPVEGKDFQLAIDSALQEKAHTLLEGKLGAVVGLKPETGEVLILESAPGFDPQIFEDGDSKRAGELILDETKPLFNRALEGNYPPGSTFKMFVATAGLEEKVITPEETIMDNGVLEAGPLKFHNWYYLEYGRTEGEVDMVKSLQRSNDIYYYTLGAKLGPERIRKWAELFGFQSKTGIGLHEISGIIPSSFWKEQTLNERWYLGDTYNLSIGQGYVTSTPLQVAAATAVFANGGYLCKPNVLKATSSSDKNCTKVPFSEMTYNIVREGMKAACTTGGTAYPFFDFRVGDEIATESASMASGEAKMTVGTRVEVGCKTGTAESHAISGKALAWFTIFAPFDKPEIVLTVLVEEGGQGSDEAAPIAKDILKTYFERSE
ncbi:hypothetical protein KBD81_02110 [Candidatus Woesebacteria bacterium]|nr:hypothetical protein [Candidatus Woesebacteria bacterium]